MTGLSIFISSQNLLLKISYPALFQQFTSTGWQKKEKETQDPHLCKPYLKVRPHLICSHLRFNFHTDGSQTAKMTQSSKEICVLSEKNFPKAEPEPENPSFFPAVRSALWSPPCILIRAPFVSPEEGVSPLLSHVSSNSLSAEDAIQNRPNRLPFSHESN